MMFDKSCWLHVCILGDETEYLFRTQCVQSIFNHDKTLAGYTNPTLTGNIYDWETNA